MKTSSLGLILLAEADESLHHAQEGWKWARSRMLKYQIHTKCSSILKFLCLEQGPSRDGILCDHSLWPHSPRRSFRRLLPSSPSLSTGAGDRVGCKVVVPGARGSHLRHALTAKAVQCWDVAASKRLLVQLKTHPFPSCPFASSPPSLPPSLTLPFSFVCLLPLFSPIHCQEGPRLKGQFSAAWQRQRLAPAAAATVSGSPAGAAGTGGLVLLGHGMTLGLSGFGNSSGPVRLAVKGLL